jgi:phosphate transport system protein
MPEREHLSRQYEHRLRCLKDKLLLMGAEAEQMIADSIMALVGHRPSLADNVIIRDNKLDALEIEIDDLCYEILALEKPVACDLRVVATALKIVKDIERVGDLAVNIAERTIELTEESGLKHLLTLPSMADDAQNILRRSLDAFVNLDVHLAYTVIQNDRFIDETFQHILHDVLQCMAENPQQSRRFLKLIFIAKHLERVGDHSKNIAEMVIFMVRGQRHPAQQNQNRYAVDQR